MYSIFTKRRGLVYTLKNLSHLLYYRSLSRGHKRFEEFINNKLILTKEYASYEDLLRANLNYDCYISGSDQIWNPIPYDFDWSYYLGFVSSGKKISYAPSFGQLSSVGDEETSQKIVEELAKFDEISVREQGASESIMRMLGVPPRIVLDPTMLFAKKQWLDIIRDKERIIKEDYIFFYTLFADSTRLRIVKNVSKYLNLPIVVCNFSNQYDVFNPFIKCYDAGPIEFLTLIRDAKLVVASSYHGTALSILLNIPFFAINGLEDARIKTLLKMMDLESREISLDTVSEKCDFAYDINFSAVNEAIDKERLQSIEFLKSSIGI